jgi:hypothetical protein
VSACCIDCGYVGWRQATGVAAFPENPRDTTLTAAIHRLSVRFAAAA